MKKFYLFLRSLHPERTSFLIGIIFYFLFFGKVFSQVWYQANPYPTAEKLRSINFPNANTGYAAGYNGVIIKTTNGGANWTLLPCVTHKDLSCLAFKDANTGIVGGDRVFFKTSNGGLNWENININSNNYIMAAVYPGNETFIVSGGDSAGYLIIRSTNSGLNWIQNSISYDTGSINRFSFINQNTGYIIYGGGTNYFRFLKTTNGGANWNYLYGQHSSYNHFLNPLGISFLNEYTGFVSGYLDFICKTTDGGYNWITLRYDSTAYLTQAKFLNLSTGIVAGDKPLITNNGGINWSFVDNTNSLFTEDVSFLDNNKVIMVGGNIFISTNTGINWTQSNKRLDASGGGCVLLSPSTAFLGNDLFISKTTNSGLSWVKDTSIRIRHFYFINSNTGMAIGQDQIYRTTNSGNNWIDLSGIVSIDNYNDIKFINNQTGIIAGSSQQIPDTTIVKLTTNGGINWQRFTINHTGGISGCDMIDINTFYVVNGNIYKTTNSGSNWIQQTNYNDGTEFWNIKFLNANTGFAGGTGNNYFAGCIVKTTNGGNNWFNIYSDSTFYVTSLNITPQNKITIILTYNSQFLNYSKICVSTDLGITWNKQFETQNEELFCVSYLDSIHAMASGGPILFTYPPGSFINVKNISSEVPEKFELKQNYPNPFNPSTIIRYQITNSRFVTLKVYDILGREIETLVNEFQKAGTYETQFPNNQYTINQLASGVYFYKLVAGDFVSVKKMVLMK